MAVWFVAVWFVAVWFIPGIKKPRQASACGVLRIRSLAMCYSHMGKPHTTIAAITFHF